MARSLARRVRRLEAAREGCAVCGGQGALSVVIADHDDQSQPPRACPACGKSLVVEIHKLTMEEWHGRQNALA